MNVKDKLEILADAAKYDASCASSGSTRKAQKGGLGNTEGMGICHSYTPDGRCVSLLKILLTNHCLYDCVYCINRSSSSVKRAKFTVEEVVWLTLEFYKRNYIEGLFLSSGVIQSADHTMEEMVEVARSLRVDHSFGGYIHLKAVAGSTRELVELAGTYADRVSANIELATQADMSRLAPAKTHAEIESSMASLRERIDASKEAKKTSRLAPQFAPGGQSTQMIVGATSASDAAILTTASGLYEKHKLRRVYYSAFSPIPDGDPGLPFQSPPLVREHRLYQADWLIRFYGFDVAEIVPEAAPNLDLGKDPKLTWALRNRAYFPVDVNRAPRSALLRIPGFGVRNVDRIVALRRHHKITLADLAKMRVALNRARYFVTTADHNPSAAAIDKSRIVPLETPKYVQRSLFEAPVSAVNGEL